MRTTVAMACMLLIAGTAAADERPSFSHLRMEGQTVHVLNSTQLAVTPGPGFTRTGPHDFLKVEEDKYHFEVSLVSFVEPSAAVSVTAERLVETSALNYDELPPAKWPDSGFLQRASGCATLTPQQAAAMPAQSGMKWLVEAGFVPDGSFAFEASLLLAPDKHHEATIELIARVNSCADTADVEATLSALRARIVATRAASSP